MAYKDVVVYATRSDGVTFQYNDGDWIVPEGGIEGIDELPAEFYSKTRGYGTGEILTGVALLSREITITTCCKIKGSASANKRKAFMDFHKKASTYGVPFTYKVYVTYKNQTAKAENCYLIGSSMPMGNIYSYDSGVVIFKSLDPFLYDNNGNKIGGI